ncbi:MAG: hypothetical protein HC778_00315 [Chamaesiphon sp. CSU_1_12]|nr:hypothetical protein [Chamaesiphon sp. CSU_1_12]
MLISEQLVVDTEAACHFFLNHEPPILTIDRQLFDLVFKDGMGEAALSLGLARLRSDGRVDLIKNKIHQ